MKTSSSWPLGRNSTDDGRTVCRLCGGSSVRHRHRHRSSWRPIFTWTGFYAGVNAGWGWRDSNEQAVILGGAVPGTLFFPGNGDGGFIGGGQIGYNWQFGSFVVGAETDIQWVDSGNSEAVAFVPSGPSGAFVPGTFRE